jgi:branched-chain amino acid transport system ATP-binding protein
MAAPMTAPGGGASPTGGPLFELRDVSAGYGSFKALFGVSLQVAAGQACALLGPNGAGKTTIARVATGLIHPTAGQVLYEGRDITKLKTYQVARLGISHAPEGRSVFASLTVEENLLLSLRQDMGKGAGEALAKAYELFPRLGERRTQLAGTLSGGEQRQLSLARVMVDPPTLLVVDELSLGLAPVIVQEVYEKLALIKAAGTTLLIIEQYIEQALAIADQIVVMNRGEVVYAGAPLPTDQVSALFLNTAAPA